ncbi:MAG: hypothetical protein AUJ12_06160 [Alphaproteobacteria bacterium CG1_02_46_17]|nr:MAG: hypothetical protein AUJ12_06160 [Alphaproteobacteria bacterium CG1_02_46_17]
MRKLLGWSLCGLMTIAPLSTAHAAQELSLLTPEQFAEWNEHPFKDHTIYTHDNAGDGFSLKAECNDTASALYREVSIDLTKTPIMKWSWRIDSIHSKLKEKEKIGDDYPARIYVVYTPNVLTPWRTLAIDYVWSNNQSIGSVWPNAFTGNAIMVALRSGKPSAEKKWETEERNVRADFKKYFNQDLTSIDGVAIMTDCDNAGFPMTGYYKNIRFTAE